MVGVGVVAVQGIALPATVPHSPCSHNLIRGDKFKTTHVIVLRARISTSTVPITLSHGAYTRPCRTPQHWLGCQVKHHLGLHLLKEPPETGPGPPYVPRDHTVHGVPKPKHLKEAGVRR